MKRIDLFTLRLFVAIADTGRLTAAAEREHLVLAAVSKRVSDLEAALGTTLLYRRPRGVALTPAGEALQYHARKVLESMEHLRADLSEYSAGVRGHVRLHANTSAIIEFLPADLAAFTRTRPRVRIDLEERLSIEVIQAVRDGLTDIGIYAAHIGADGLQTQLYRYDQLVLVTSRYHPLATHHCLALCDAVDFDFVGLQQDASLHTLIHHAARAAGKSLRMRVQVRSFEGICRMIASGLGIGVLPVNAVTAHVATLDLHTIELTDDWAHRELRIACRDLTTLSVPARKMVEHLSGYEEFE